MTYDEIIEQLEITKSKIKEIARNEYGGESWNDDLDALTEAADIVADYSKATAQASEMSQKYEQPAMAVRRAAGLYTCPLCGKRTQVGHTHCHWCGKKLSWDREAYADRDYPHMSTKGGVETLGDRIRRMNNDELGDLLFVHQIKALSGFMAGGGAGCLDAVQLKHAMREPAPSDKELLTLGGEEE